MLYTHNIYVYVRAFVRAFEVRTCARLLYITYFHKCIAFGHTRTSRRRYLYRFILTGYTYNEDSINYVRSRTCIINASP